MNELSPLAGPAPTRYQLDFYYRPKSHETIIDVTLERILQADGSFLWAIRESINCLSKKGEWVREASTTRGNKNFIKRCRWSSAEVAVAFYREKNIKSHGEMRVREEMEWLENQAGKKELNPDGEKRLAFMRELIAEMDARRQV
jgi:hypothetical protein